MIASIISIVAGLIGITGFLLTKVFNSKKVSDLLIPYQGGAGVALFFWGVWLTLGVVTRLEILGFIEIGFNEAFLMWIAVAVLALSNTTLGFLLGYRGFAKLTLTKNEEQLAKAEKISNSMLNILTPFAFLSLALGALALFRNFDLLLVGAIAGGVFIIAYAILLFLPLMMGEKNTTNQKDKKQETKPTNTTAKSTAFYETKISNVTCVAEGASYKIGIKIIAKKFVIDSQSGKEKEVLINNDIQIGMMKDGKEIYLKNYKFTKPITSLSLVLSQKPDKIGIDPYNLLPEKAQLN